MPKLNLNQALEIQNEYQQLFDSSKDENLKNHYKPLLNPISLNSIDLPKLALVKDKDGNRMIFLGEIKQMPGHGLFLPIEVRHISDFSLVSMDEA